MNVINIDDYRKQEHVHGDARCLSCGHEWEAKDPVGTTWLDCPGCGLKKGRFQYPIWRDKTLYNCNCGNDLFQISEKGIYCPMCGSEHKPFE